MKIHLLSGFLGSGKTTAIQQAAKRLLARGIKTGIVTNDQGAKLVDGGLFRSLDMPSREVINGCFCCNYNELDNSIASLAEKEGTEVIFAESVGSCTDIVATVLKPLLQFRPGAQVTISVFADSRLLQMILDEDKQLFDDEVRYIYLKQLEEAGIIIINKTDLVNEQQLAALKQTMQASYGSKTLLYQNSLDETSVQQWLTVLDDWQPPAGIKSLEVDYDVYAAGEARLAWVDQLLEVFSTNNDAMQVAQELINAIYRSVCAEQYPIGHLKFLVNNSTKISFTSFEDPLARLPALQALNASILVNMRVQTTPDRITALLEGVVADTEKQYGCNISASEQAAFQPGYPTPVHRM